jgi:hypothetical protein
MGIAVTVVCSVAAYTYTISEYLPNSNSALGYTGIVNGAKCAFQLTNADSGDFEELFNITTGVPIIEGINCTVPVGGSVCITPYITFIGTPFAYETIEIEQFFNGNVSGYLNGTANWTYIALPPVPSQTPQPSITSDGLSINLTTSAYSQDYGYGLIGCVVSGRLSPYGGSLAPLTLSSNAALNSIPIGAYVIYASPPTINQSSSVVVPLSALYVAPSSTYDFHWVCYNSQGRSPDTLIYGVATSAALPVPSIPSSSSSSSASRGSRTSASSSTASTSTGLTGGTSTPNSSSSGLSNGAIAGIVIGSVVGAVFICLFLAFFCGFIGGGRRTKKDNPQEGMGKHSQLEAEHQNQETVEME